MKKEYSEPTVEILYVSPVTALCASGEGGDNLGGNGDGEDPWSGGRAPKF